MHAHGVYIHVVQVGSMELQQLQLQIPLLMHRGTIPYIFVHLKWPLMESCPGLQFVAANDKRQTGFAC